VTCEGCAFLGQWGHGQSDFRSSPNLPSPIKRDEKGGCPVHFWTDFSRLGPVLPRAEIAEM
jgi:hypothetical protein